MSRAAEVEARCRQIKPLLDSGHSYGQIAKLLKTTRNAIAGFCHRNGLTSHNVPGWNKEATVARWADPQSRKRFSEMQRQRYAQPGAREKHSKAIRKALALRQEARA